MIKILLAFDHELPLGRVKSTFEKAIFEPTYRILESADRNNFKVNLFTDILCALAFRQNNVDSFFDQYSTQLQKTLQSGHDVQLHLHPHWIDTRFVDDIFYPSNSFRLADFKDGAYPHDIEGIIEQGINELTLICKNVNSSYVCNSYRAGGYNLSPETERILNALYNNGIRIDSSIYKNYYYKSDLTEIDYRRFHKKGNFFIPLSGPITATSDDGMFEIPIANKPAGLFTNLKHIYYKRKYKEYVYTTGLPIHSGKVSKINKLKSVFSSRPLGFDIISLHANDLIRIVDYYIKNQDFRGDIVISSVSHPKNMGSFSVKLMEEFVQRMRDRYDDIEFCTYTDIYNELFKS